MFKYNIDAPEDYDDLEDNEDEEGFWEESSYDENLTEQDKLRMEKYKYNYYELSSSRKSLDVVELFKQNVFI